MPATRKLRDTDMFLGDKDEFGDETDPFEEQQVSCQTMASSTEEVPEFEVPEFECDEGLPEESLELENKTFLLQLLDLEGGPQANNRKTRPLAKFTSAHPCRFGTKRSERHCWTKWLLDRWKRDKNFAETKKVILSSAVKPSPQPSFCSPVASFPGKRSRNTQANTKEESKSHKAECHIPTSNLKRSYIDKHVCLIRKSHTHGQWIKEKERYMSPLQTLYFLH